MINELIECKVLGKVRVKSSDISYLFKNHKEKIKKAFKLTDANLKKQLKFKTMRGGVLIEILKDQRVLAIFTLSNVEEDYLELGDLLKLDIQLPRDTLANALRLSCSQIKTKFKKKCIFAYPNSNALKLELKAGFQVYKRYVRTINLIIFGKQVLLPIKIYNGAINFEPKYLRYIIPKRINVTIKPTRLRLFRLKVYKRCIKNECTNDWKNFGFLYQFLVSNTVGDPFITFGGKIFPKEKICFENSDNSA